MTSVPVPIRKERRAAVFERFDQKVKALAELKNTEFSSKRTDSMIKNIEKFIASSAVK
jgi:hypothetical protein